MASMKAILTPHPLARSLNRLLARSLSCGLLLIGCGLSACEPDETSEPDSHESEPSRAPAPPTPKGAINVLFTRPGEELLEAERADTLLCAWLDQARSRLDIAAFELDLPCVPESLKRAAKRGVQVRLVVDSENPSPELKAIAKAKIPIIGDERGAFMHNKFIVRDNDGVWTGSLNFTVSGVERNNNNALWFNNAAVAKLYRAEFDEMFNDEAFGPSSPRQELPARYQVGSVPLEVLFSPEDPVRQRLLETIKAAKHSIRFMAFSFTDDEIGKLLIAKSKAGVEVHGMFEKTGSGTAHSEYGKLKKAKIDVRRDGNTRVILHHKVFIVDDETVVTGSYNFSKNADKSNDENLLILRDKSLAKAYTAEYEKLYAEGE